MYRGIEFWIKGTVSGVCSFSVYSVPGNGCTENVPFTKTVLLPSAEWQKYTFLWNDFSTDDVQSWWKGSHCWGDFNASEVTVFQFDMYNRSGSYIVDDFKLIGFSDNTPPIVSSITPSGYVSGNITVHATCTDTNGNSTISLCEYRIGSNQQWIGMDGSGQNWQHSFDTRIIPDGQTQLEVRCRDDAHMWGTNIVTLIVNNSSAPIINITAPDGVISGSTSTIRVIITDDNSVDGAEWRIDAGSWTTLSYSNAAVYRDIWDISTVNEGYHDLSIRAWDNETNYITNYKMIFVNNIPSPTIQQVLPLGLVSNTIEIVALIDAGGGTSIAGAEYAIDVMTNAWIALTNVVSNRYTALWNTTTYTDLLHHIYIRAWDTIGQYTNNTSIVIIDNTPPIITIYSPLNVMENNIKISALINDTVSSITKQEFKIDTMNWQPLIYQSSGIYTNSYDGLSLSNGIHSVSVNGRDATGHSTTNIQTFYISNVGPTITLISPIGTVSNYSIITADIVDSASAILGAEYLIDTGTWITLDKTGNKTYSKNWNTKSVSNGQHSLRIRSWDYVYNYTTNTYSFFVSNIQNTPPIITILTPAYHEIVSGTNYLLSATITDDTALIYGSEYKIDNGGWNGFPYISGMQYGIVWNSVLSTNGYHTIAVRAYDMSNAYSTNYQYFYTTNVFAPSEFSIIEEFSNKIVLTWTNQSKIASYIKVYYTTNIRFSNPLETQSIMTDVTLYTLDGLIADRDYIIRIVATNTNNHHAGYSLYRIGHTQKTAPAVPSNLIASGITETNFELFWTDNADNEDAFIVYQNNSNIFSNAHIVMIVQSNMGVGILHYLITNLQPGETNYYWIAATNKTTATLSGSLCVVMLINTDPPAAPSNLLVLSATTNEVILSWIDKAVNESAYIVYYGYDNTIDNAHYSRIIPAESESITISDLIPNSYYYCWVVATNNYGRAQSEYVAVHLPAIDFSRYIIHDIVIAPNPWKTTDRFIRFYNIPSGITIQIYSSDGICIIDFDPNVNSNPYKWRGQTENGKLLSPGVYFIRIQNKNGKDFIIRKFAVIQ